ncbi:MAG: Mannose-1-phosphate guanylyltransferase 1 [Myxococcota bacterium]|nr:Mannose-1-phosphate guanylyltransferase 1 [Myxococcota bacterium]
MAVSPYFAVIMAGGSGTRLWPASRANFPKQFLDIPGPVPMLRATVDRLPPEIPLTQVLAVTGETLAEQTRRLLPDLPRENILAEPVAKNTAPCVGWAAVECLRRNPEAIIAVLPSDQHIANTTVFRGAVRAAMERARGGAILTLGIRPTRPETGYGYIERAEETARMDGGFAVHRVVRFVEKPDRSTAQLYLDRGVFEWNSGMFFFRGDVIRGEIHGQLPGLDAALARIAAAGAPDSDGYAAALREAFGLAESVSIDVGVMENARRIEVIPCDMGWNDVGSWQSLRDVTPADDAGNHVLGETVVIDSRNCVVVGRNTAAAVVGMEDIVVAATPDAVLVCKTSDSQRVREVVDALRKKHSRAI